MVARLMLNEDASASAPTMSRSEEIEVLFQNGIRYIREQVDSMMTGESTRMNADTDIETNPVRTEENDDGEDRSVESEGTSVPPRL